MSRRGAPRVSVRATQRRLAVLWISLSAIPFLLMAWQTMDEKFSKETEEAWGWLLPTIMPTLLLVLGTVVADGRNARTPDRWVDKFFARLAFGVSAFYLGLVMVSLLVASSRDAPVAALTQTNIFLGPAQGIAAATLGVFFASRSSGEDDDKSAKDE